MALSIFTIFVSIIWPTIEFLFYCFHFLMLLLLIWKKSTVFSGAFYNIFRILMAADMIYYITYLIGSRFPNWGLFVSYYLANDYLATIFLNILSYIALIQFIGQTFLSLNRFVLLVFPSKYKTVWEHHWYTIIIVILPFLHICYRITSPAKFVVFDSTGSITFAWVDANLMNVTSKISSYIYILTTVLEGIFSVAAVVKYYSLGYNGKSHIKVNEIRLLSISCTVFVAQLIRSSFSLLLPLFMTESMRGFYSISFPIIIAICAWSRSLSLILLSPSTRKAFAVFYFPWKNGSNSIISTTVYPFKAQSAFH